MGQVVVKGGSYLYYSTTIFKTTYYNSILKYTTTTIYYVITRRFSEWQFRDWQNGGQILTYWWFSDFFFEKKGQKNFPTPHGFHLKTFPTPHGCQKVLKLPLTGSFYPWRELIFSLKKLFLTPTVLAFSLYISYYWLSVIPVFWLAKYVSRAFAEKHVISR